ncbi:MAG: AAA family ATPase [Dehalococcoidia bacterium]|nr:AAA family ATPase [Dehalococcoidia bacterium]
MLVLSQLTLNNFRSVKKETFSFQSLSVLIGKNNTGKTNILHAISILLEGTSRDVTREEFFDRNKDFLIQGKFSGVREYLDILDQRHRPRIEERIDDTGSITVRRVGNSAELSLSPIQIRNNATGVFDTPTGIDAALKQFLPEVVHVKPLADVADEVSGKAASSLTKILTEISNEIEAQAQPLLDQAYENANALINVVADPADPTKEQDQRVRALTEIEGRVTSYLQETFPKSKVRLKMEMPTVKEILGGVNVLIHDGVLWKPYFRQGHGIQRVLLLSLLRALAIELRERPEDAVRRPFMLLIEEPELFLYPLAQEQIRDALESISASNQVIYATHSPLLLSPNRLCGLARLHKVSDPETNLEETKVVGTPILEEVLESEKDILAILSLQRSAQLFFADTVILVEGEADRHLHRAAFQKLFSTTLELEDIALVEIGGKDRLTRFKNILTNVCPRILAIADVDYIWEGAGNELASDADLSKLVQQCRSKAEQELASDTSMIGINDNEKAEKLTGQMKKCCFASDSCDMRDTVCAKLEALGTLVLRRGDIEAYVGLGKASKGKYLSAAKEIASGERNLNFEDELHTLYSKMRSQS